MVTEEEKVPCSRIIPCASTWEAVGAGWVPIWVMNEWDLPDPDDMILCINCLKRGGWIW